MALGIPATSIFWIAAMWFIGEFLAKITFRILFAVGIGFGTYKGVEFLVDELIALINQHAGGLGIEMLKLLGTLEVDTAISIILSSMSVASYFAGLRVFMRRLSE